MAQRISQLPDIAAVRGITRPSGQPLKEASTTYQAGEVGSKLDDASGLIRDRSADLDKLASGADQVADGLKTLREQVTKLLSGLSGILTTMQTIQNQFGGATTLGQLGDPQLVSNMRALGDSMQAIFGDMTKIFAWIDPVVIALDGSPYCNDTPLCVTARDQFHRVQAARDDGSLQKLVDQLQSSGPASTLTQTVTKLSQSMKSLTGSMGSLGLGGAGGGRGQSPLGNLGACRKA